MLENQCVLEIVDPEIVAPEIVNPEIVNLEIVNFGGEGAIRHRCEIDVTSDSLRKDLTRGVHLDLGMRQGDIWRHPDVDVGWSRVGMQWRVARQLRTQRRLQRNSGRSGRTGRKNDVADVRTQR